MIILKSLLYIDACVRDEESRTKRVAEPIMEELAKKYDVTKFVLNELSLDVVKMPLLAKRLAGDIPQEVMSWAEAVRDADRIVIAAPFWDMGIPAVLKTFFELCSIFDVTFKSDDKTCYGNCKAEKMLFITSRGMNISTGDEIEQATPYLRALSWLWGIGPLQVVAMQNMDYVSTEEIENKIATAIKEGLAIAEEF